MLNLIGLQEQADGALTVRTTPVASHGPTLAVKERRGLLERRGEGTELGLNERKPIFFYTHHLCRRIVGAHVQTTKKIHNAVCVTSLL